MKIALRNVFWTSFGPNVDTIVLVPSSGGPDRGMVCGLVTRSQQTKRSTVFFWQYMLKGDAEPISGSSLRLEDAKEAVEAGIAEKLFRKSLRISHVLDLT
ncbi:MAG: hypothetical protein EB060_12695 [Proteobacteria bacterium]|nr:hypothetical protein [Pseudomonadota bacterium]